MNNKIEEIFDPPFAYYKHAISGYVVRPLNWEGIWKDGFIFVAGNTMLNCSNEEDAKMIADTFNRFFELLKENKDLKHTIKVNEKSRRKMQQSLMQQLDNKNKKIEEIVQYVKSQEYEYEDDDESVKDCCCDGFKILEILRGEDFE